MNSDAMTDNLKITFDDKTVAAMIKAEPTPEELEYLKRVASDPPIPYPPQEWHNEPTQPAIDWEKVARARLTSLVWEALPDHWQHGEIEAAKAAVAEYLRQAGNEEKWMPIETIQDADQDGLILFDPAFNPNEAFEGYRYNGRFHGPESVLVNPTHYKYMPKPPTP